MQEQKQGCTVSHSNRLGGRLRIYKETEETRASAPGLSCTKRGRVMSMFTHKDGFLKCGGVGRLHYSGIYGSIWGARLVV